MIPKPPKKSKIQFNNPDFHQQKKDFNKQIREIIFKFHNLIPRSQNRDLLLKFLDCINPGKDIDVTRLPYIGKGPNAKESNRLHCLFALISNAIFQYWNFVNPEDGVDFELQGYYFEQLSKSFNILNSIHKNGLDQYQIKGNLASGFYLEKK